MTPLGEGALIEQARAGSTGAFARLVDMHQQAVRAFLRKLSGSHADADDLAQETFLTAWQHLERFEPGRNFRVWLMGYAYRKFLTARRSWFRRMRRDAVSIEGDHDTASPGAAAETRLDLSRALAALPADQRAALAMCLAEEFTHTEAAEALGLPVGTVKSHIARGKAKLLAMLESDDGRRA